MISRIFVKKVDYAATAFQLVGLVSHTTLVIQAIELLTQFKVQVAAIEA